ncbi:hypothetical protein GM418_05670 [Maribellus comscasis]|uniref:Uncharacterized protein n=1 Tax=Maribellus comscasis TaxID=2681766 RepID=A0A6I6JUS7_9BACT|nr:DUF6261 family protein [Maribellus comscasis]QGY43163.1 hypothetical protein GM418_05670 [Maribellus comscasis]
MIPNLLSKSRVTEADAVSMRIISAFKSSGMDSDPHLPHMFNTLDPFSKNLTSAINRSKAESNLEEKDEKHDGEIRSFSYLLLGLLHHPDDNVKAAAQKVKKVFDKYGVSITGKSYASESSLVASLLNDLAKPNLQDTIAQLSGCAELIAALQAAQDEFEAARLAYEQEKAQESTAISASVIKRELVDLLNGKIVVYLRAMEIIDEATYGAFPRIIAKIIDDNNETVKKRNKKEEPEMTV